MSNTAISGKRARDADKGRSRTRFETMDLVILIILVLWALVIVLPFISVIAASFSTQKEYLESPLLLFPLNPTIENYKMLFQDGRIWVGYRTTLTILLLAVPMNMFLTTSVAYGLSRPSFPFKKFFLYAILFTMLFHGGIVPMYLLMMELKLTNTIWSVVLASGVNTFYLIIMRNYFTNLPDSLMESAKLDGAGEWRILFQIVLPLSMPIIATILLFYSVDRWNEWFNAMIFLRKNNMVPLQLVLRSIVIESRADDTLVASQ
ncbi:MAG: carbohydrate ABC transporter permease, partial [Oscillospiraceae bacterium]|nr:carbohydrate ABC transporter permease [Oscillospiraceae bacterium]